MEENPRERRPIPYVEGLPLAEVVPARAVLTELARGFLLSAPDPERAKRFATSFLKEQQAAHPPTGRVVPLNRQPAVRRGVDLAWNGSSRPR